MLFDLLGWWYKHGWLEAWRKVSEVALSVLAMFAVPVLLRTLFSPWKQIISLPGRSIDEKFRASLDNLISRLIGFLVRLGALMVAALTTLVAGAVALAVAVCWPAIPLLIV